jgi:MFS transporter, SET family, sugar efflux transporter
VKAALLPRRRAAGRGAVNRLLIPSTALLWGLQIAFLNPALALILVSLYDASTAEVGVVLGVYNASGFVASLLVPAYADRRGDYLRPMLGCAVLTLAVAVLLGLATTLPLAVVALVVVGGPAGVGSSLLYAHLRHAGAKPADIVNTRAIVSVAWVAGPPLATLIIGTLGSRAILLAIAAVAVLNIATTAALAAQHRRQVSTDTAKASPSDEEDLALSRSAVVLIVAAFVLLQAGNATVTSILTLFVTETLRADVVWAGFALGMAAGLEVPALVLIGRLSSRYSSLRLLTTGTLAGIVYYLGVAAAPGPVLLLILQPLNAWAFAAIAGVGLPLFQQMIPRPGLSTGLYMNTRRIGAIVSGPLIALGSLTVLGNRGIFLACAAVTAAALAVISAASRRPKLPPVTRPPRAAASQSAFPLRHTHPSR